VASCATTADYIGYYVEQYNPGKLGIQPHNFERWSTNKSPILQLVE